jgi:hypothetical protein
MFEHDFVTRLDLPRVRTALGRFYDTPIGTLPSVTTVLDYLSSKTELKQWRERVGDVEADAITNQAVARGQSIHDIAEGYVLNNPDYLTGVPTINRMTFRPIKILLDDNLHKVYGCELPLYSFQLKSAGTADVFGDWMGSPTIIDYKTARRPMQMNSKKLRKYKLQTTAYAIMAEELYHRTIPGCVIICVPDRDKAQVFHFKNAKYRKEVLQTFSAFTVPNVAADTP